MTSMQIFESNLGTRNEAEAASLLLDHARQHLTNNRSAGPVSTPLGLLANVRAIVLLTNLSLIVFPDQEIKIRRGGL